MSQQQNFQVFVVDDEPQVCKAISQILSRHYQVECFNSAEDCMSRLNKSHVDCNLLISDVRMPGMSGMEFLESVKRLRPLLPVVLITGYGDVPMVVRAMHAKASDFIEKPLHREKLLRVAHSALKNQSVTNKVLSKPLTKTEKKVLQLMLDGLTSRKIADGLDRSVRTIEEHRQKIKQKLGAKTQADIFRIGSEIDLSGGKIGKKLGARLK